MTTTTDADKRRLLVKDAVAANKDAVGRRTKADPLEGRTAANRDALRAAMGAMAEMADAIVLADLTLRRLHLDEGGGPGGAAPKETSSNPLGLEDDRSMALVSALLPAGYLDDQSAPPAYGDATGEAALRPDAAVLVQAGIRQRLYGLADAVRALVDVEVALAPIGKPPQLDPADERRLRADNAKQCCESCARVQVAAGVPWECVNDLRHSDVGGRLHLKHWLCRWCRSQVERTAPARSQVERAAATPARRGQLPELEDVAGHRDRVLAS
jgi:hypothetical protein